MLFIHGKKTSRRLLGQAAADCPACQRPTACKINRVALCDHIYYIASGDGKFLGFEAECTGCRGRFEVNGLIYPELPSGKKKCFNDIRSMTMPWLDGESPEAALQRKRVDRACSTFARWNPNFEELQRMPMDKASGIAIAISLGLAVLTVYVSVSGGSGVAREANPLAAALGIASLVSFLWMIKVCLGGRSRHIARTILPRLVPQLRIESVDSESILEALRRMKRARMATARWLKPSVILSAMNVATTSGTRSPAGDFSKTSPVGAA